MTPPHRPLPRCHWITGQGQGLRDGDFSWGRPFLKVRVTRLRLVAPVVLLLDRMAITPD